MSIDWNTAPEGATHWEPRGIVFGEGWMKKVGNEWSYWLEGSEVWAGVWADCFVSAEREATFEARPQEAWDGQGLPPVGTTCIVEPHNTLWGFSSTSGHERKILAYHTDYVWLGNGDTPLETTRIDKVDFRPIHTPEQIAAEERSKECDRIFAILSSVEREGNRSDMAEALYDAGYRRQESST
ncbi:hypothetical protein DZ961_015680 [Pseudomonas aeruginosa]|uniref:hypothetical protein n=1 Tax=Pseudomonas aeruginosa TaxID=287 RepID=UPI000E31CAE4|nr:hypothetical protein [Pseudomonas aeruginosa]NPY92874.1 hypothetical protein [Pseudomonas aeruginosa]